MQNTNINRSNSFLSSVAVCNIWKYVFFPIVLLLVFTPGAFASAQKPSICQWLGTFADIVTAAATTIIAYVAYKTLYSGLRQYQESVQITRAEFVLQLLEKLRYDDEIVRTMNHIDYHPDWYKQDFHGGKPIIYKNKEGKDINTELTEKDVDKLLAYLDYVCYLKKCNLIKEEEFYIFQYKIVKACKSCESYLRTLHSYSKMEGAECSFQRLIDYGLK